MDASFDVHAPLDPTPSSSSHPPANASDGTLAAPRTPRRPVKRISKKKIPIQTNVDFYANFYASNVASALPNPLSATSSHSSDGTSTTPSPIWSSHERDIFFSSLSRHTQRRPDLIALDLAPTKTLLQVCLYLSSLQAGLLRVNAKRTTREREWAKLEHPAAREMSERWVQFEEDMAEELLAKEAEREREATDQARSRERKKLKRVSKDAIMEKDREWFRSDWTQDLTVAKLHAIELEYHDPTDISPTPSEPFPTPTPESFPTPTPEPFPDPQPTSSSAVTASTSPSKSDILSGLSSHEIIQRIKDRTAAAAASFNASSSTAQVKPLTKKEQKRLKIEAGQSEWHERRRAKKEAREAAQGMDTVERSKEVGASLEGEAVVKRKRKRGVPWKQRSARIEVAKMGLMEQMEDDGLMLLSMKTIAQWLQMPISSPRPSTKSSSPEPDEDQSPTSPPPTYSTSISHSTLLSLRSHLKTYLSSLIHLSLTLQPTSEDVSETAKSSSVKILPSGETEVVKKKRAKKKKKGKGKKTKKDAEEEEGEGDGEESDVDLDMTVVLKTENVVLAAELLMRDRPEEVEEEEEEEDEGDDDDEGAVRRGDDDNDDEGGDSDAYPPSKADYNPLPQTIFNTLQDSSSSAKRPRFASPSYSDEDSDSKPNTSASLNSLPLDPLEPFTAPAVYLFPGQAAIDMSDYEIADGLPASFDFDFTSPSDLSYFPSDLTLATKTNASTGLTLHLPTSDLLASEDENEDDANANDTPSAANDEAELACHSKWDATDGEIDGRFEEKVWRVIQGMDEDGKGWSELEVVMKDWEEGRESDTADGGVVAAPVMPSHALEEGDAGTQVEIMDED